MTIALTAYTVMAIFTASIMFSVKTSDGVPNYRALWGELRYGDGIPRSWWLEIASALIGAALWPLVVFVILFAIWGKAWKD